MITVLSKISGGLWNKAAAAPEGARDSSHKISGVMLLLKARRLL